ncbi:Hint domain-containing protein, partial [Roseicyclus sp.]|uniref:Hint domain-containing protein n=1 Tax=Roseicyclus sp. TaxID=1914329 RepID=UPI003F6CBC2B
SISGGSGNDTILGGSPETVTSPNLIVNGSFEAGVADGAWQYFSNGNLAGWQSDSGIVEVQGNGFAGITAADGTNWAEIDADSAVDNIYQDVTTPAGESLTLSFEAQQRSAGDTQSIEVWFGGVLIDTITPTTNAWQTYSYTVTGSGTDRLEFRELSSQSNSFGPLLDNVSLTGPVTVTSDDTLSGGDGDDSILGEGGDDLLFGDAGNDTLSGGSGDDTLFGGDGDDVLIAGNNTGAGDSLSGGAGDDILVDSFWNATLDGGTGSDLFELGYGNATVIGGEDVGNTDVDLMDFQTANDAVNVLYDGDESGSYTDSDGDNGQFSQIEGIILSDQADTVDASADTSGVILIGNDGDDLITGGQGADFIEGGADNDSIAGGAGNDTLLGGSGEDTLVGGDGNDTIDGAGGNDTIDGGAGTDTIDGGFGNDLLSGGDGNDTILGGSGDDTIDGGAGDDLLVTGSYGGAFATSNDAAGNTNVVSGGDGNDTILASVGADTLSGDAGDDSIDGQGGDDVITGGDGRDTLQGGAGADTLTGGTGADAFIVDDGGDIITDFDTTTGIQGGGTPDQTDNDFVDLSTFYNETTLAAWNAANPTNTFVRPIDWLRADHADDGALAEVGGLQIRGADGQPVAANELNFENTNVVCFANGTRIATAQGAVKVEDLKPGDLVMTMDHGLQPLRWIGSRRLDKDDLNRNPNLRPIRLCASALGMTEMTEDLLVSPQHRIMMASPIAQRMFGCSEVLVAAKDLVTIAGIAIADNVTELSYHHLLFDDHEIVFANGIPAESLYLGTQARKALSPEGLAEIHAIFPEFAAPHFTPVACRPILSGKRARKLGWRHSLNRKPLIDPRMARATTDDAKRSFLN